MMETRSHTALDKEYIDHAIKFMARRGLADDNPVLDRLQLEITQVKFAGGFLFIAGVNSCNRRTLVLLDSLLFVAK